MFQSVAAFAGTWEHLSRSTLAYLEALTDPSLAQSVAPGHRTLGRIAWHVVLSLPEMMGRTGLVVAGPAADARVPASARDIAAIWRETSASLLEQIRAKWTDATLEVEDDMYGEKWKRGFTLGALVLHQVHHLGQMSVLMRRAGLAVPGIFGPSREEWAAHGMQPPAV